MTATVDVRAHAHRYAELGLRVLPVASGKKSPALDAWQDAASTDLPTIDAWWTGLYTGHGIGLAPDRLPDGRWWFVVDIDQHGGVDGSIEWYEFQVANGAAPDTVEATTGGGGTHLLYAAPHEIRSGVLVPGIDIKGHGGQIVVEPSRHSSGQRYAWVDGHAPWEHPVVDAPGWLLDLLEPKQGHDPPTPAADAGDRPGDIWAAAVTWDELLSTDGWQRVRDGHGGEQRWVRPGKSKRDGISATVGYKGSDVLKNFSSSIAGLVAEETYTKLGYWAATRHGGDHSAAAKALRAAGYHRREFSLAELAGEQPLVVVGEEPAPTEPVDPSAPWPDPEPLPEAPPPPPWPVGVLPDWVQAQVDNVAAQVGCDPMLPGMFGLGALLTAGLGHVRIRARAGHVIDATAYLIAAAPSAAGKSPALEMMFGPIREYEQTRIEHARADRAKAEATRRIADTRARKAEEAAAKDNDDAADRRAGELRVEAELIAVPPEGRLIVSDITPEKLATIMADNTERIAIVSDEAGILDVDHYGSSKHGSNMDLYLQAHSGKPCIIDRQTAPSVNLARPLLAIVAGVQPKALAAALVDIEFAQRGLGNRLMYATSHTFASNVDMDVEVWDSDIADRYDKHLGELARHLASWAHPAELELASGARRAHAAWAKLLRARQEIGGDLDLDVGWVEKMKVTAIAIAALLHLADGKRHDETVDVDTMGRAIELGDYWIEHRIAERVDEQHDAKRLLASLVRLARKADDGLVSARDIGRGGPRGLRRIEEFAHPLVVLAKRHLVRIDTALPAALIGGEPAGQIRAMRGIRVHPKVLGGRATTKDNARQPATESETDHAESEKVARVARVAIRGRFSTTYPQVSCDEALGPQNPRDTRDNPSDDHAESPPPNFQPPATDAPTGESTWLLPDDDDDQEVP